MRHFKLVAMKFSICCLLLPGVLTTNVELGEMFETGSAVVMINEPASFIFTKKIFKQGTVVGFKGMFANISSTVKFQIWRHRENSQYLLVGEKHFTPPHVPAMFEIPLSIAEHIPVRDGDLLGFSKTTSANSVVTQFDGSLSMGVIYSPETVVDSIGINGIAEFDPTPLPLKLSVMALYQEDKKVHDKDGNADFPTVDPTEIMKSTFPPRPEKEGSHVYFGASIFPRESVLDQMSQVTFLLPVGMLPAGELVKFFAYIKGKDSVLLQVWREVSNGIRFKLIGQYHFTPNTTGPVEIVLDENDFIPTQLGDCLGFTQLESTSSIGYNFNSDMDDALRPLVASDGAVHSLGQEMSFVTLGVPYDFGLGAMIDTDSTVMPEPEPRTSGANDDSELVVPREPGESILSQSMTSDLSSISTEASRSYLMESLQFREHANVTAFSAYTVNNGLVQFQIWRRVNERESLFKLIGKKNYLVTSAPGLRTIRLAESARIAVSPGDIVGFANPGDAGVIGYVFHQQMSGLALYTSLPDVDVPLGQQVEVEVLAFPYKFSIAVNYVGRDSDDGMTGVYHSDGLILYPPSPPLSPDGVQPSEGEKLISQAMQPTSSAIARKASQTYIVATLKFPEGGKVTSFSAYVVNNGQIQFQIWRQLTMTSFQLIGAQNVTLNSAPGFITVRLQNEIDVQPGDLLGFVNKDDRGIVGYKFEESSTGLAVYISAARLSLSHYQQMAFDLIRLPYKFSLAATYRPDEPSDLTFTDTSGSIVRGRPTSGINPFDPDVIDESQLGPLPDDQSGKTSTKSPSGLFSTTSGKNNNNENGLNPSEPNSTRKTTPSDNLIAKRKLSKFQSDNAPAALQPLTNVSLILIMLIWLILVTLSLIGCFAFWLYKKRSGRPYNNYLSYRSSSVPSLAGSACSPKDNDSLTRLYNSSGLFGGPGFPDSRYERSSRIESENCNDGSYL